MRRQDPKVSLSPGKNSPSAGGLGNQEDENLIKSNQQRL